MLGAAGWILWNPMLAEQWEAECSLGINTRERSREEGITQRVGNSVPQLSKEPWSKYSPTELSYVRKKWPDLCTPPHSDNRCGCPSKGMALALQEQMPGSHTPIAPSSRPVPRDLEGASSHPPQQDYPHSAGEKMQAQKQWPVFPGSHS